MLKKVITLALVAALVLLASGVALAQIGVFDTRPVEQAALSAGDLDTTEDVEDTDGDSTGDSRTDSDDPGSEADEDSTDREDDSDDSDRDDDSDDSDDSDRDDDSDESDRDDDSDDSDDSDRDEDTDDDETLLLRTELSSSGPFAYQAGDAGTVRFAREGSQLLLLAVDVNQGWYVKEQEVEDDEIEIEFHNCDKKVEFKAEYDDGQIKLEVKASPEVDDEDCFAGDTNPGEPTLYQAAEAGTVTLIREGSFLKLGPLNLNSGWFVREQEVESDEIEIEFHNGSTKVEFEAEYDDGQIKLEVKSSPDDSDD